MPVDINSITPLQLDPELVRTIIAAAQTQNPDQSWNPPLASLPDDAARWNFQTSAGTGVDLSYFFSSTAPGYDPGDVTPGTYEALTPAEQANCEAAMAIWAECIDVTFTEAASAAAADIVFRKADLDLPPSVKGFAFFPPQGGEIAQNGDVFLDLTGADIREVVVHELGHALGLGHTFEGGNRPVPADFDTDDTQLLSVMSYTAPPRDLLLDATPTSVGWDGPYGPEVPMPIDILAAQMMYGANMTTRTGNSVYSYDVDPITDGVFYQTIWDAGGTDTIDLSNQDNPSLISLVEGSFSSVGVFDPMDDWPEWATEPSQATIDRFYNGTNALAIAFNCVIENATGGSAGDRLIGNAAKNKLTGNAGNDTAAGAGGNDTLLGGAGNDSLDGSTGNDSLDGGAGNDTLKGGGGNDTYVVNAAGDVVQGETGGTDTVRSSMNFTLGSGFENLVLTGTALRGKGNGAANTLTGNGSANTLAGSGGADKLIGNGGNDVLRGGLGNDTLTGGVGNDTFQFDTTLGATNRDTVADFDGASDTIQLDQTVFGALGLGTLATGAFRSGAGIGTAGDADDRIIYNTTTGALFYDADGNAAGSTATQFALLTGAPTLAAADFVVIA